MFGDHCKGVDKFDEHSEFRPMSPYAVSKVSGFHICSYFKRVYGLKICTALSFNHESPMRNQLFVTQKIVRAAVYQRNSTSKEEIHMHRLYLGNLRAIKDWGHSAEYCDAYYRMMGAERLKKSTEMTVYVVATDQICTVQNFCTEVFLQAGFKDLQWVGEGVDAKLIGKPPLLDVSETLVEIDPSLFRPGEVPFLRGNYSKIR